MWRNYEQTEMVALLENQLIGYPFILNFSCDSSIEIRFRATEDISITSAKNTSNPRLSVAHRQLSCHLRFLSGYQPILKRSGVCKK